MFNTPTLICILIGLFLIEYSYSFSITGILDAQNPDVRIIALRNTNKGGALRSGIFDKFLHSLLDNLSLQFPLKKLPKYCRMLSRKIYDINYKYAQRLARHIKYLSRMYPEDLRNELLFYKEELNKMKPHRYEFLDAMNKAFTLKEHILFNDYIYELANYATGYKLYIDEETDKLIDLILDSILRLSSSDRKDLRRKLRYAVREFIDDNESSDSF